jgi:hypothetical protein
MAIDRYILIGHEVVPFDIGEPGDPDYGDKLVAWAKAFEETDRRVAFTTVGVVDVSTVFLGLDHAWFGGAPQIFETMVFIDHESVECERCATWAQAEAQHQAVVDAVTPLVNQAGQITRSTLRAVFARGQQQEDKGNDAAGQQPEHD